jgi:hypothetical protein
MIFGLLLFIYGLREFYTSTTSGALARVDAAAYQSGNPPSSLYVSVTGKSLPNQTQALKNEDAGYTTYYIPVVSANWNPSKPVGLFLKTGSTNAVDSDAVATWQGMIDLTDLPGVIRTEFEKHLTVAAEYRVLELGENPQGRLDSARFMMVCSGFAIAMSFAFLSLFGKRRLARYGRQGTSL